MPRIRPILPDEASPEADELIQHAEGPQGGAPDPRVVRILSRTEAGRRWVAYWRDLLHNGLLPHKMKEMCRIYISVAHQCGYCSTVRAKTAQREGLTEEIVADLYNFEDSSLISYREKAALRYARLFKMGEEYIDSDSVYEELRNYFSEEEIIELGLFCGEVDGAGKFVKSLNVISWSDACELNPSIDVAGNAVIDV